MKKNKKLEEDYAEGKVEIQKEIIKEKCKMAKENLVIINEEQIDQCEIFKNNDTIDFLGVFQTKLNELKYLDKIPNECNKIEQE